MIRFQDYFLAQFKRIVRLIPGIMIMTLVMATAVGAIYYSVVNSDAYKSEQVKYRLGIVGSTEDEMLSMGVQLMQTNDESRYMLELVEFDNQESASAALRDGEVNAFVVVSQEFVDSMNALSNDVKLKYYATSGQKGITNVMMDELAAIASNVVVYSEKGMLSMRDIMKEEGAPSKEISASVDELFMLYLGAMLARTDVAEFTELGLSDGLNTTQYYSITMLLFFAILSTFCAISFFLGRKKASYQFMAASGFGPGKQVLAEYIVFFMANGLCVLITGILIGKIVEIKIGFNMMVPELLFTAMAFFIFEIVSGVINKFLVAFIAYMGMSYISGYFYPKSFFPEVLRTIGQLLPTGAAFSYMEKEMRGINAGTPLVLIIAYAGFFILASMLARKGRIK